MRYFLLEEDKNYVNRARPYRWTKKISSEILYNKSYSKIPKRIILEIEPNVKVDFVDIVTIPFFMERLRKKVQLLDGSTIKVQQWMNRYLTLCIVHLLMGKHFKEFLMYCIVSGNCGKI